ncbi:MAG: hypothetical protein M3Q46_10055 [Verrucomicrobiota bacterium]|nr:hypothetical protein [Verrucomicrobiota bacterium]
MLVLLLCAAGLAMSLGLLGRRRLRAGVPIIYRVVEASTHPGPEAQEVHPSEHGELYYYLVRKYWRVEQVLEDGWIVALTPLMEHHYLRQDDPNLRKANLVERLRFAARFPAPA